MVPFPATAKSGSSDTEELPEGGILLGGTASSGN